MRQPQRLHLDGKLASPARLNATIAGQLLFLEQPGRRFLVDSGASVSLLPHKSSAPGSGPGLVGPNGAAIATWGREDVRLQLGEEVVFWPCLRAAVSFPILGIDFLGGRNFI